MYAIRSYYANARKSSVRSTDRGSQHRIKKGRPPGAPFHFTAVLLLSVAEPDRAADEFLLADTNHDPPIGEIAHMQTLHGHAASKCDCPDHGFLLRLFHESKENGRKQEFSSQILCNLETMSYNFV